MFLGVLLDLGLSLEKLQQLIEALNLEENPKLLAKRETRCAVSGYKFDIQFPQGSNTNSHHHGRHFKDIKLIIEQAKMSESAKSKAFNIFKRIGLAEAKIHNKTIENIHFHEVGGIDSIIDILGAAWGVEELGIEKVFASTPNEGKGTIQCVHGIFPVPAPATLEILKGITFQQIDVPHELITPTGAAILTEFSSQYGTMPPLTIEAIGYGLGSRELKNRPNALRAVLGQSISDNEISRKTIEEDTIYQITTNIDHLSSETLGYLSDLIMKKGALDVALIPITMKKSRPAYQLQVLVDIGKECEIAQTIFLETGTLGLRIEKVERMKLYRESETTLLDGDTVRLKLAYLDGEIIRVAPEYDDCQKLAQKTGKTLATIQREVIRQWHSAKSIP